MKKTEKPYVSPSSKTLTIAIQRCIATSIVSGSSEEYIQEGAEGFMSEDGEW